MHNDEYEMNYSRYIEPVYGDKRDMIHDDTLMSNDNLLHEYSIPFEERYNFSMYDVYSIDPEGCKDADDAFSIYEENDKLFLVIHIADPTNYIKLNSNLWNDIVNRTTTKYLSNRAPIHMMPHQILEMSSLMTFDKEEYKNTISIIIEIDKNTFEPINKIKLVFGIIKTNKNNAYTYAGTSDCANTNNVLNTGLKIGSALFNLRKEKTKGSALSELSNSYIKYNEYNEYNGYNGPTTYLYTDTYNEKRMKQMIAEFAIFANSYVGEYLKINLNTGIFRTCAANEWLQTVYTNITGEEMLQEIITNGIRADYMSSIEPHDLVGMPEYCHFTSPIRRLSDCVCHYLLKFIYFQNKNSNYTIPFNHEELNRLSFKCVTANKKDKKNQYLDVKFRLLQVMHNIILQNGNTHIEYYITSYSGLFLNIIISKIDNHNIHMSYTLRVRNYLKEINAKQKFGLIINIVNCFTKFDENTIPELDRVILT